jgi:hypothetical protein
VIIFGPMCDSLNKFQAASKALRNCPYAFLSISSPHISRVHFFHIYKGELLTN